MVERGTIELLILQCAQVFLAWLEVWMCYQLIFAIMPDYRNNGMKDRVFMWGNIAVCGSLLTVNRNFLFFSYPMHIFCIILTGISLWMTGRKRACWGMPLYYILIALIDFFNGFMCISILKQDFARIVYTYTISGWQIGIFLCTRICVMAGIIVIHKERKKIEFDIMDYYKILLLISVVFSVVLRGYQIVLSDMVAGERHMKGAGAAISMLFILLLSVFGVLIFYRYQSIQKENSFLISRNQAYEQYYKDMSEFMDKNRQIVHDIKHHLLVLRGYEERGDTMGLRQYLEEISEEYLGEEGGIYTGSRVADIVLNQKKSVAKRQGILFEFEEKSQLIFPLEEREICAFFGNLLDNALEACARMVDGEKWIRVKIERQGKMLFIEVANSISEKPRQRNKEWISLKADRNIHGYGIKSVRRIVEKYEGTCSIEVKENAFYVNVTFFDVDS